MLCQLISFVFQETDLVDGFLSQIELDTLDKSIACKGGHKLAISIGLTYLNQFLELPQLFSNEVDHDKRYQRQVLVGLFVDLD